MVASGLVAMLGANLIVWQGSNAAFTAETYNAGNNWQTGKVGLTDSDGGAAMFAVAGLTPGAHGERCIAVTATSDVPGTVKVYLQSLTAAGLEDNITVSIEQGTGGTFGDCAGFTSEVPAALEPVQTLAAMFAAHGVYTNAVLPWTKSAGPVTKTYKFTWAFDTTGLDDAQVNALQGLDVQANFEWELQNT
jgi:hypothetical protein